MTFSQFKGTFSGRAVAELIYSESLKGVLSSPQRRIIEFRELPFAATVGSLNLKGILK